MRNSLVSMMVIPKVTILCLVLTVFFGPLLGSSMESPQCSSFSFLPDSETATKRINDLLEDGKDIIEVHFKTNATFDFTEEDETVVNKTLDEANAIEKYNTSIYFIVTPTGKSIMKYPADADFLSFGLLGSQKEQLFIDVVFDSYTSPEKFRECCLKKLTMNDTARPGETSICYFHISKEDYWNLPLPYRTYNTFKTFCISHENVEGELSQELSNKLLWWFCIFVCVTFPAGIFFIPHSINEDIKTYRREDIPYSVSMFLSFILYGDISCCVECPCYERILILVKRTRSCYERIVSLVKKFVGVDNGDKNTSNGENKKRSKRMILFLGILIFVVGVSLRSYLRAMNSLENDLTKLTGSGSVLELALIGPLIMISYGPYVLVALIVLGNCNYSDTVYPIYIISWRRNGDRGLSLYNANDLEIDVQEPQFSTKMLSEIYFSGRIWRKVIKEGILLFVLNFPLVLFFSIPVINMALRVFIMVIKKTYVVRAKIIIAIFFLIMYIFGIVFVNALLIEPLTLLFQILFMTIFVGIPIYPRYIGYAVLFSAAVKFYIKVFVDYQKQMKHILGSIFAYNDDENNKTNKKHDKKTKDVIRKKLFSFVHARCPSASAFTTLIKLIFLSTVVYTALHALHYGVYDTDKWNNVITPVVAFLALDVLSKFFNNEEADKKYIVECVNRILKNKKPENRTGAAEDTNSTPGANERQPDGDDESAPLLQQYMRHSVQ